MHILKTMSLVAIALGFALMVFKIYADSEPGAIPLALIVLGLGSYFVARSRIRSSQK